MKKCKKRKRKKMYINDTPIIILEGAQTSKVSLL